jgi:hypothetical protein
MFEDIFIAEYQEDFFQLIKKESYECLATGSLEKVLSSARHYMKKYVTIEMLEMELANLSYSIKPSDSVRKERIDLEEDYGHLYDEELEEIEQELIEERRKPRRTKGGRNKNKHLSIPLVRPNLSRA